LPSSAQEYNFSAFFSPDDSSGVSSCTTSSSLNPTHRAQSAFIPRHSDEVLLDIGDAIHVDRTCEDHWCYGTNLRTGMSGIFPSAVVCEIDIVEEICMGALPSNANKVTESERDTFYLTMLASIEVGHHKGNDVLVQAMNKVLSMYKNHEEIIVPQTVLMEISFRGIHVIDKRRKNILRFYHKAPVVASIRMPCVFVESIHATYRGVDWKSIQAIVRRVHGIRASNRGHLPGVTNDYHSKPIMLLAFSE
ncbi:SH3 domain protein, partial [Ancylostoma duodenale]